MMNVLTDKGKCEQLNQNGYVTLPFLNADEIKQLEQLFYQHTDITSIEKGLYSNLYVLNGEENWQISSAIEAICSRAFKQNFANANLNAGVFIAKGNFAETNCNLHQDYTNTNESTGSTYALWIPLCDIDKSTGLFNVIPGSHRLRSHIRCITNSSFYLDLEKVKPENVTALSVKAGEAVVFDHALIHGSQANTSGHLRIAAVLGVLPEGLPYQYYLKTGENSFSVYRMDKEFYIRDFKEKIMGNQIPPERYLENITAPTSIDEEVIQSFLK